jgi:hypothetical protein
MDSAIKAEALLSSHPAKGIPGRIMNKETVSEMETVQKHGINAVGVRNAHSRIQTHGLKLAMCKKCTFLLEVAITSRLLNSIYKSKELERESTVAYFATVHLAKEQT